MLASVSEVFIAWAHLLPIQNLCLNQIIHILRTFFFINTFFVLVMVACKLFNFLAPFCFSDLKLIYQNFKSCFPEKGRWKFPVIHNAENIINDCLEQNTSSEACTHWKNTYLPDPGGLWWLPSATISVQAIEFCSSSEWSFRVPCRFPAHKQSLIRLRAVEQRLIKKERKKSHYLTPVKYELQMRTVLKQIHQSFHKSF